MADSCMRACWLRRQPCTEACGQHAACCGQQHAARVACRHAQGISLTHLPLQARPPGLQVVAPHCLRPLQIPDWPDRSPSQLPADLQQR